MSPDEHVIRKLMPKFIVSVGTRAVLKVAKAMRGGEEYKPPGSISVVVQSPPSSREADLIQFADGQGLLPEAGSLPLRG